MAHTKPKDPIRLLAERIADDLFTPGHAPVGITKAQTLELMFGDQYLGGWAEKPLADRIEMHLRGAPKAAKDGLSK